MVIDSIPYPSTDSLDLPIESEKNWRINRSPSPCKHKIDTVIISPIAESREIEVCLFLAPENVMGILVNKEFIFKELVDKVRDLSGNTHSLSELKDICSDELEICRTKDSFKIVFRLKCSHTKGKTTVPSKLEVTVDLREDKWEPVLSS